MTNKILSILFLLSLSLNFYQLNSSLSQSPVNASQSNLQPTQQTYSENVHPIMGTPISNSKQSQKGYIKQEYIITSIQGNEYYGKSVNSDNGIFFTAEYINSYDQIKTGDTIQAFFENEYDDSLVYVEKVSN